MYSCWFLLILLSDGLGNTFFIFLYPHCHHSNATGILFLPDYYNCHPTGLSPPGSLLPGQLSVICLPYLRISWMVSRSPDVMWLPHSIPFSARDLNSSQASRTLQWWGHCFVTQTHLLATLSVHPAVTLHIHQDLPYGTTITPPKLHNLSLLTSELLTHFRSSLGPHSLQVVLSDLLRLNHGRLLNNTGVVRGAVCCDFHSGLWLSV